MRLAILLFILKIQLIRAANKDPVLKKRFKKRNYTAVIRTKDSRVARYFTFSGGDLVSGRGNRNSPDIELVWDDAGYAFSVLAANDNSRIMKALGESRLTLEGNLDYFFWFGDTLDQMSVV